MLTLSTMTRRIQIPVGDQDRRRFQAAARRSGLSLAEWARRQLRAKADATLGGGAVDPLAALALLENLEAPVSPLESMIEESVTGRYS